jgi:hypothetical protein
MAKDPIGDREHLAAPFVGDRIARKRDPDRVRPE